MCIRFYFDIVELCEAQTNKIFDFTSIFFFGIKNV